MQYEILKKKKNEIVDLRNSRHLNWKKGKIIIIEDIFTDSFHKKKNF